MKFNIINRKRIEEQKRRLVNEIQAAHGRINRLSGDSNFNWKYAFLDKIYYVQNDPLINIELEHLQKLQDEYDKLRRL